MDGRDDDVYAEAFYHFVWSTKGRQDMIDPRIECKLYAYIRNQCTAEGVIVHAINGMPNHIHIACTLPPKLSAAAFMQKIKGSSSHYVNQMADVQNDPTRCLYWQRGYGYLTFSNKELPRVVQYVTNQKDHHQQGKLSLKMESDRSLLQQA